MPPNLSIRNISEVPLTLVNVEHFEGHDSKVGGGIANITAAISNVTDGIGLTNVTRKTVLPINLEEKPFEAKDVSIAIAPITLVRTDIPAVINKPTERLRLTFQTQMGGKHQMDIPVPTTETAELKALAEHPLVHFSGVFLPESSFVTLFTSNDPKTWMSNLPDSTPLGALSIPGTHNAPTFRQAPPSVRCQAVSPTIQLQNGVRFFDLRVQVPEPYNPSSDALILVHSVFPISLTGNKYFRDLYTEIRDFLNANPTETLILSIKREGTGKGTDEQLSRILKDHYTNPTDWFTQPRVPSLGEARRKCVLVRRFNLDEPLKHEWNNTGWGIDGSVWADNTPCANCPSGDICVQDFYQVMESPSIAQKITYARDQLERSGCCKFTDQVAEQNNGKIPLYINFLSASNFWNVGTWPEKIAAKVNPAVVEHLCAQHMLNGDGSVKEGDWSTGVVVSDWVGLGGDWDLVRCVVGMNAKLLRR